MNRRAATALRFLAVVSVLSTVKSLVVGLLRDATVAKLNDPGWETYGDKPIDTHAIIAHLHAINSVSTWAMAGILALTLVGFVMLAASLERTRGLVTAAIVGLLAYAGYMLFKQLHPATSEPTLATMFIWVATTGIYSFSGMAPLIAASRETTTWRHAGTAVGGAIVFAVLPVALDAFGIFTHKYSPAWQWAFRVVDVAYAAWFVVYALKAARVLEEGAPAQVETAPGTLDPGPLRSIGWAILVRVGVGFAVAVGSIIATMHGSFESMSSAAIGSTVIGVLTTLFLIGGLVGYARYPAHQRNDGLYIAVGLMIIAVILDIVSAKTSAELYGLAEKAQQASSMWSMPSISDMESMQVTILWTGRLSMLLGLVSMLVLLGSLATTARSIGAEDLARRAGVTMALAIIAVFGAILVTTWVQTVRRSDESLLLGTGLILLVVGVSALVNLLRVVFGVANAIERPTIPGANPLPEARVVER
ncbi:MAG TPA: hypothetical protein VGM90_07945 [Kofleriaceae bacterium]|jgi:hypothetical protein